MYTDVSLYISISKVYLKFGLNVEFSQCPQHIPIARRNIKGLRYDDAVIVLIVLHCAFVVSLAIVD